MGRTCGEPDELELTAIGVKLNGSRTACGVSRAAAGARSTRVPPRHYPARRRGCLESRTMRTSTVKQKSGVNGFRGFCQVHHSHVHPLGGAQYARRGAPNEINLGPLFDPTARSTYPRSPPGGTRQTPRTSCPSARSSRGSGAGRCSRSCGKHVATAREHKAYTARAMERCWRRGEHEACAAGVMKNG